MSNPTETPNTLVIERVFQHPLQKLWRALTESPLLAQWMMNNDFEPVVGRKFQFRADPMPNWNGIVDCEVLIVEPLQRLVVEREEEVDAGPAGRLFLAAVLLVRVHGA